MFGMALGGHGRESEKVRGFEVGISAAADCFLFVADRFEREWL